MDAASTPSLGDAVARLHTAVDDIAAASLTGCADGEVLAAWRELERVHRRLAPVDHRLISEVDTRNLVRSNGSKSTAQSPGWCCG